MRHSRTTHYVLSTLKAAKRRLRAPHACRQGCPRSSRIGARASRLLAFRGRRPNQPLGIFHVESNQAPSACAACRQGCLRSSRGSSRTIMPMRKCCPHLRKTIMPMRKCCTYLQKIITPIHNRFAKLRPFTRPASKTAEVHRHNSGIHHEKPAKPRHFFDTGPIICNTDRYNIYGRSQTFSCIRNALLPTANIANTILTSLAYRLRLLKVQ